MNLKTIIYLGLILLSISLSGCSTVKKMSQPEPLNLLSGISPIVLSNDENKFYKDIPYGEHEKNVFDIFLPASKVPASLVIYIHGGGFTGGDKAKPYIKSEPLINNLLTHDIAFASINYRLLRENDGKGLFKCLNDCKRALQFIRYHAGYFNIDKQNIILMGGSAGAGASLWIGLQDEMADKKSIDAVLHESTRVKGIVALLTQASYDVLAWHDDVFQEYQSQGFDQNFIVKMGGESKLLKWYGFGEDTDFNSADSKQVRDQLNMLKMMSNDDPEMYIENTGLPYVFPTSPGILNHHALHAKALLDRATLVNAKGKYCIPKMGIDTRNGESMEEFIIRKLNE